LSKLSTGVADVPAGVLDLMTGALAAGASQYPVFSKAPLYMRNSLVFPYTRGMVFQNALFEKLGKDGFAIVFRDPPASTQQIMHPEKYLDHVMPRIPKLPALPEPKEFRDLGDGTLGEFDFSVLLEQYAGKEEADATAPHIAGGKYALFESKRDKHPVLVLAANWDSADSAGSFFKDYRKVLAGKSKDCTFDGDTDTTLTGHNDRGYFRVRIEGGRFESVEGYPAPLH